MQVLDRQTDIEGFFRHMPAARERVLILDYDGTLAPFHTLPQMAYPYPDVAPVLDRLMREGDTRVVIVSGRPVDQVMPLLGLLRQPEIWGAHGWERLSPDGHLSVRHVDATARDLLDEAQALAEGATAYGARVERKRASVALHWRGLSAIKGLKAPAWIKAAWQPLIGTDRLELHPFRGGLELMARGRHKRYAVQTVLEQASSESAVAYLGDDHSDEEAFMEVAQRGLAVLVGDRLRDTQANLWIRPPQELRRFIGRWWAESRA
jgi:trehalose-phosphatase